VFPVSRLLATIQYSIPLVVALLFTAVSPARAAEGNLSQYTYEDTKRLVSFVDQAAALIEHNGEHAFAEFGKRGSKWLRENYLFVYTPDGTNVFHPIEPGFVGKNLINLRDVDGKSVVRLITDIAKKPTRDASGWVFYLWEDQTQLIPLWKSSYIRKAVSPDGKIYLVGSGLYNMKIEKTWIEDRVNLACALLQSKGKTEAFKEFMEASSPFVFLGTYIFVLDEQGHTLVDPAFPTMAGRDLSQFRDAVGMPAIQELLRKLTDHEDAWVQYLWPKPGSQLPSRKLIYAHKVTLDGQALIIGSDFFLATPIWMKQ
jgi:signal transduction histidine kinase